MSKAYEAITQQILELMEQGTSPWHRPWKTLRAQGRNRALNAQGRPYRGINAFILTSLPFEVPIYLTYRQAAAMGGNVRKGSKGFPVLFWKLLELTEETAREADDVGLKIPMARFYTVFNVAQTEGVTLPEALASPAETVAFNAIEDAERLVAGMPQCPSIEHGYTKAFYRPSEDVIGMPSVPAFDSLEEYYSTLLHELVHSTGHVSRLNRKEISAPDYTDAHAYSREELVAELGSALLCAQVGVDNVRENQAAYLRSWHERLQKDPAILVMAAAKAQKAADFILVAEMASAPKEEAGEAA